MNTSRIALNNDRNRTPAHTVAEMFDYTDENGVLYIPEWVYEDDNGLFYKLVMNWNKSDVDSLVSDHAALTAALTELAPYWDTVKTEADSKTLPEELQAVWNTYIRDFDTRDMDLDRISEISDKIDAGEAISYEESEMYDKYRELVIADAKARIGDNIATYDVILRAKRFCRLTSFNAPRIIIDNESNFLIQAMAVHKYGKSMEILKESELG